VGLQGPGERRWLPWGSAGCATSCSSSTASPSRCARRRKVSGSTQVVRHPTVRVRDARVRRWCCPGRASLLPGCSRMVRVPETLRHVSATGTGVLVHQRRRPSTPAAVRAPARRLPADVPAHVDLLRVPGAVSRHPGPVPPVETAPGQHNAQPEHPYGRLGHVRNIRRRNHP